MQSKQHHQLVRLTELVLLEDLFADALKRIAKLEEARWGLKVDGSPKKKPGRKQKEKSDVRIS